MTLLRLPGLGIQLLDGFDHSEGLGHGLQYYQILAEFSRLNRSEMRGFKRLFRWALEHARQSELELPSRMQKNHLYHSATYTFESIAKLLRP